MDRERFYRTCWNCLWDVALDAISSDDLAKQERGNILLNTMIEIEKGTKAHLKSERRKEKGE